MRRRASNPRRDPPATKTARSTIAKGSTASMPGDAVDPARARLGVWAFSLGLLASMALLILGAIFEFGPFAWSQGFVDRLFGHDSVVVAALPVVALTLWLPIAVLRWLPRRPKRSFLCGMQDALDPKRNPNWRSRLLTSTQRAQSLRRCRMVALVAAGVFALVAVAGYALTGKAPENAGKPLPRLTLAALASRHGAGIPPYARLVDALPGYDQAWLRRWNTRSSTYDDYYLPLRAPGQSPADPVAVVMLASYPASGTGPEADPPVPPLDGALSMARFPTWMRTRMREHGFELAENPVLLRRMTLDGRLPGADEIMPVLSIIFGGTLTFCCLMMAWLWTRALRAIQPRR